MKPNNLGSRCWLSKVDYLYLHKKLSGEIYFVIYFRYFFRKAVFEVLHYIVS